MARLPDPRLRADWIARLGRFGRSSLTVADFCADEGVSVSSFYQWRRKLRGDATRSSPAFVSLRVRDAEAAPDPKDHAADSHAGSARQPLRVELPGGLAVACDERIDAERLAELLTAAVRATSPGRDQSTLQSPAGGLTQC